MMSPFAVKSHGLMGWGVRRRKSSGLVFPVLVPALPLIGWVTLGKLLQLLAFSSPKHHGHVLWWPQWSLHREMDTALDAC